MVTISIVIPVLNEENFLPKLLKSIDQQTFTDYEIIVADAGSKDNTVAIAKKYGAKIVKGGMPAVGRNNGAKFAKGEFLFFFDADIVLPKTFLKKVYKEMQERFLDMATCEYRPISNLKIDKILHKLAIISIKISQYSEPLAPGFCIFMTKRLFDRIGGFNEKLNLAEDHDLVKRAAKFRKLRVLSSTKFSVSVRRLSKEGRMNLIKKYIHVTIHRAFLGEVEKDIINYEFGDYTSKNKKDKLVEFEKSIDKFNKQINDFKESSALSTKKFRRVYDKLVDILKKGYRKKY